MRFFDPETSYKLWDILLIQNVHSARRFLTKIREFLLIRDKY